MSDAFDPHYAASGCGQGLRLAGLALFLTLAPAGCGGGSGAGSAAVSAFKDQVVTGRTKLASGKPLTKGRVVLLPLQEPFTPLHGNFKPDGTFTLTAWGFGIGVSYGDFQVSVEPPGFLPGGKPKGLAFPAKYLDPTTSGLKVTITPETKELPPFELK